MTSARPVRVLHLINGLSGGGLERWLRDVVRLSDPAAVTHRVVVVYPDLGGDPVYAEALAEAGAYLPPAAPDRRGPGARLVGAVRRLRDRHRFPTALSLPLRLAAGAMAAGRVGRALREFRPDVVHSHSGPDVLLGIGIRALTGIPLVHTVPCLFSQMADADYHWLPGVYRRAHRWIDRFSTGESRTELIGVGVPPEKILYDLGGVDLDAVGRAMERRDEARAAVRTELGIPADAPIALSVGRLHPSKGHDRVVEALPHLLRQLPDLHWVALGEGPERPALEARAAALGVAGRTHLVGFHGDPFPFFAAADLYLRSTLLEPENLSFYQAMAAALPAVGFTTDWRDLIDEVGQGETVPDGNPRALADAAARILSLPDRGRGLGEAARDYALRHLDVRASVALLAGCYAELARAARADP